LVKLPGGQGYVEVVKQPASGTAPITGEITFYVLKDMTEPYSPAPSSGTLTAGKRKVSRKTEGDALVTPEGPPLFTKIDVDGILTVDLGGKPVQIPLGVR
jgi:hypothetical protein